MKRLTILLSLLLIGSMLAAQGIDASVHEKIHRELLSQSRAQQPGGNHLFRETEQGRMFSIFADEALASIYTREADKHYLLHVSRQEAGECSTLRFTLYTFSEGNSTPIAVSGFVEKRELSMTLQLEERARQAGYTCDPFIELAACLANLDNAAEWWEGSLRFEPTAVAARSYYATRDEAVRNVPQHVEPKYCFVWKDGPSSTPWRPIPGTGCAHWVAHQKGIQASPGCYDRYAIRVSQVTAGKRQYSISQAQVGDIWTNTSGSHCGIVIGTGSGYARVRHCSSGSGGVVIDNFTSGYAYR